MSTLRASVVIPTYGRSDSLDRCLESLKCQLEKAFEVIVVHGGDSELVERTTRKYEECFPIRHAPDPGTGLAKARNIGWRMARAPIVSFIDDDVVAEALWMSKVCETFASSMTIGGVSGPTIIPEDKLKYRDLISFQMRFAKGNLLLRMLGSLYLSIILEDKLYEVGKILKSGAFTPGSNYRECLSIAAPVEVDYLEACNMSFLRELVERVGGFDETYSGTADWTEPDMAFKIKRLGYRLIFHPQATVYHYVSQEGIYQARARAYERSQNFIRFYMRWIKPNSFDKAIRFIAHLAFLNAYWCYKFASSGNRDWLLGIWGTLRAFGPDPISAEVRSKERRENYLGGR
jgi:GT2 family glycosyltransferase